MRSGRVIAPCCSFEFVIGQEEHIRDKTLAEYVGSPYLREMREKSLRHEPIPGCARCAKDEEIGIRSTRDIISSMHPYAEGVSSEGLGGITSFEVFLGNACNLKCVSCSSQFSSAWIADESATGLIANSDKNPLSAVELGEIFSSLTGLREVKVLGGEPFINASYSNVLMNIPRERRGGIEIKYNTNVTIFPEESVIEMWKDFRQINLHLSIDFMGPLNDYIRYPSQWQKILNNFERYMELAKKYPHIRVGVSSVVSVYNIFFIKKHLEEYERIRDRHKGFKGLGITLNRLQSPLQLGIDVLPDDLKERVYLNNVGGGVEVDKFMRDLEKPSPTADGWERCLVFTDVLDRHRKVSVRDHLSFWPREVPPLKYHWRMIRHKLA